MIRSENLGKFIHQPKSTLYNLEEINIKSATTFPGLCNHHDTALFEAIENEEPNLDNENHRFLFAYRTIIREQYARRRLWWVNKTAIEKGLERKLFTSEQVRDNCTNHITACYAGFHFYEPLANRFHRLRKFPNFIKRWEWDSILLRKDDTSPLVTCESFFEIKKESISDLKYLIMCVLPLNGRLYVLLFFKKRYKILVEAFLSNTLGDDYKNNLSLTKLSSLILCRSENFCINWTHYQSFSDKKTKTIERLFCENNNLFNWSINEEVNLWTT